MSNRIAAGTVPEDVLESWFDQRDTERPSPHGNLLLAFTMAGKDAVLTGNDGQAISDQLQHLASQVAQMQDMAEPLAPNLADAYTQTRSMLSNVAIWFEDAADGREVTDRALDKLNGREDELRDMVGPNVAREVIGLDRYREAIGSQSRRFGPRDGVDPEPDIVSELVPPEVHAEYDQMRGSERPTPHLNYLLALVLGGRDSVLNFINSDGDDREALVGGAEIVADYVDDLADDVPGQVTRSYRSVAENMEDVADAIESFADQQAISALERTEDALRDSLGSDTHPSLRSLDRYREATGAYDAERMGPDGPTHTNLASDTPDGRRPTNPQTPDNDHGGFRMRCVTGDSLNEVEMEMNDQLTEGHPEDFTIDRDESLDEYYGCVLLSRAVDGNGN